MTMLCLASVPLLGEDSALATIMHCETKKSVLPPETILRQNILPLVEQ